MHDATKSVLIKYDPTLDVQRYLLVNEQTKRFVLQIFFLQALLVLQRLQEVHIGLNLTLIPQHFEHCG